MNKQNQPFDLIAKSLSVGTLLQNIIFYGVIFLLLYINVYIVKNSKKLRRSKVRGAIGDWEYPISAMNMYHIKVIKDKDLNAEIAILKAELLSLGEELELSYNKSHKLEDQLKDILDCLDIAIFRDEHSWDWSIDIHTNELTFSEYGLRVRGYPNNTKLTWMEALALVTDDYRKEVETALMFSLNTGAEYSMRYKIQPLDDGKERWVKSLGRIIYTTDGNPARLDGKFTFTISADQPK